MPNPSPRKSCYLHFDVAEKDTERVQKALDSVLTNFGISSKVFVADFDPTVCFYHSDRPHAGVNDIEASYSEISLDDDCNTDLKW